MRREGIDLPTTDERCAVAAAMAPAQVLEACRAQLSRLPRPVRESWRVGHTIEALYHPGRYLRVAYAFLSDPTTPPTRYWPAGSIVYLHWPVRSPSRRGRHVFLGSEALEAYCFPNDRRLRNVRKFSSRSAIRALWQSWCEAGGELVDAPAAMSRGLIRYVPEQKFVARIRACCRPASRADYRPASIVVRACSAEQARVLAGRHATLRRFVDPQEKHLYIPSAVLVDRAGLVAFEWAPGGRLLEKLQSADPAKALRRTARTLRSFHALPGDGLPRRTLTDVGRQVTAAAADLSVTCSELAPALTPLTAEMLGRCETSGEVETVTLHNDLHWDQFRIHQRRYALLDLERMCRGEPLMDVANFAAQLRMLGHRPDTGVGQAEAARWSAQFIECWARATRQAIPLERLHLLTAASLLKLAWDMMRHLRPGWRDLARACVGEAEADLGCRAQGVLVP